MINTKKTKVMVIYMLTELTINEEKNKEDGHF